MGLIAVSSLEWTMEVHNLLEYFISDGDQCERTALMIAVLQTITPLTLMIKWEVLVSCVVCALKRCVCVFREPPRVPELSDLKSTNPLRRRPQHSQCPGPIRVCEDAVSLYTHRHGDAQTVGFVVGMQ